MMQDRKVAILQNRLEELQEEAAADIQALQEDTEARLADITQNANDR